MGRTQQEIDVRGLYAGIVTQAIADIRDPQNISTWKEVLRFLKSDWGKLVCGVAGVPAKTIIAEFKLEERVEQEYQLRDDLKSDESNEALALKYDLPAKIIRRFRNFII